MRERLVVGRERLVGWQRDSRSDKTRRAETRLVLVDRQAVGDPQIGRLREKRIDAVELQVTRPAEREVDVAHRAHRRAHEHDAAAGPRV